ncbi:MAG TPA: L-rhamnose mutarotase [Chitinophagaceae bacterium]|nr:L-rhamnose mutarotase [Chitinophagaceae bacterium]
MRVAFKMRLKKGCAAEYKRRHNSIWPELKALLKENGVSNYTIFLDEETQVLFAVQDVDGEGDSQTLGSHPIMQRWWDYMADLMEVNADNSPVSVPLQPMFFMK